MGVQRQEEYYLMGGEKQILLYVKCMNMYIIYSYTSEVLRSGHKFHGDTIQLHNSS